jgi:hypothetical protein
MRTLPLGKTGAQISPLGFGCMRLPMKEGRVDRDLATPLLQRAVDLGVSFFDTAIGYCQGDSQAAVGEALEPVRNKVFISTKNHHSTAPAKEWRKYLEESLRLLRTDAIDLYNHHGINWGTFESHLDPAKGGLTGEMLKAKEEGLIRHVGFSFHGTPEDLIKLVDTGYYECVILQYNLLDQANAAAISYAHEKGLGVIVMGPVGGGRLGLSSERVAELTGGAAKTTVEAALRFVWAHPGVQVALSGMENAAMLEDNVRIAEQTAPFTSAQIQALNELVDERKRKSGLYCTACRYCSPVCTAGVSIPEQLDLLNLAHIYGLKEAARERYASPWSVRVRATECTSCGKCVPLCPQGIDIPARMREAVSLFDARAGEVFVDTWLESAEPSGSCTLRLCAHSLAEEECALEVTLEGKGTASFPEPRVQFEPIPPFGRAQRSVAAKLEPGATRLAVSLGVSYSGRSASIEREHTFAFLRRDGLCGADAEGFTKVLAKAQDFTLNEETAPLHGLRFHLHYDDLGLLLRAFVRDDFLYPSREDRDRGKLVDSVELFLDGRVASRIGQASYEPGVYQVTLYPGTPGEAPPFYTVSGQAKLALELSSELTSEGYSLEVRVPFGEFCKLQGIPRKIGVDLAVNTADASGNRIGQFVWAGTGENWQNASRFREVWLV